MGSLNRKATTKAIEEDIECDAALNDDEPSSGQTTAHKTATNVFVVDIECDTEIDEDDEPTTEEIIELLHESIQQAKDGNTRPAEEVLREVREMLAKDVDAS